MLVVASCGLACIAFPFSLAHRRSVFFFFFLFFRLHLCRPSIPFKFGFECTANALAAREVMLPFLSILLYTCLAACLLVKKKRARKSERVLQSGRDDTLPSACRLRHLSLPGRPASHTGYILFHTFYMPIGCIHFYVDKETRKRLNMRWGGRCGRTMVRH